MAFSSDLPGVIAIQHQVLKRLKKKTGLRQRDWEILCACYVLSLAVYPFTAADLNGYLGGSYYLPCLYNSINVLLDKAYITVFVPGKPFQAERYEFTWKGREVVKEYSKEMRHLADEQQYKATGKYPRRLW
ncbi:hypothetical protein [Adhaeribacter aerolatus]|uniref:hypothetical protein n=1 Tax=Adhaeribacter aerolatus TaxID=670289 RepID=UPI0011BF7EB1|nr:hypothetical protein [Adhaeribacter aerolatus]